MSTSGVHRDSVEARRRDPGMHRVGEILASNGGRYRRTATRMLGNAADAEDAVHNVALRLMKREIEEYLTAAYFHACVVNECRDVLRSRAREHERLVRAQDAMPLSVQPVTDRDEVPNAASRFSRLLERHAAHLTRRQRYVIQLSLEGKTDGQIARRLRISPKTVANHRAAAVRIFRERERERERIRRMSPLIRHGFPRARAGRATTWRLH